MDIKSGNFLFPRFHSVFLALILVIFWLQFRFHFLSLVSLVWFIVIEGVFIAELWHFVLAVETTVAIVRRFSVVAITQQAVGDPMARNIRLDKKGLGVGM